MATNKQHFLTKSADIRNQINSEFDHLIERVNTRRNELLTKLDDAVSRYQRLVRESEQAFLQLEQLKLQSRAILNLNLTKGFQNSIMYGVENEIQILKGEMSNLDLSFEWTDDFEEMILDLGTIIVNLDQFNCVAPKIDYSLMKSTKMSKQMGYNVYAQCVCVDPNTLYIYVTFRSPCEVFVYNKNGDHLLKFGETSSSPFGIAILGNKIYLSYSKSNSISKYRLRGTETPKLIKTPDISKTALNNPTLMSIDESDGHVYVCDTGNRRIVRYNKFLNYHSEICGKDNFTPLNVKITQTRIILFVKPAQTAELNTHPIRLYSKDKYQFLKSVFIEPIGNYFDIDASGNFLISQNGSIWIHDGEGNRLHECKIGGMILCFASKKSSSLVIISNSNLLYIYSTAFEYP